MCVKIQRKRTTENANFVVDYCSKLCIFAQNSIRRGMIDFLSSEKRYKHKHLTDPQISGQMGQSTKRKCMTKKRQLNSCSVMSMTI